MPKKLWRENAGRSRILAVRFTTRPQEDVARGWTGAQGIAADSPLEALEAFLGRENMAHLEFEWEEMNQGREEPLSGEMTDDWQWLEKKAAESDIDIRALGDGKWTVFDHDGLAVWRLNAQDHKAAHAEAKEREDQFRKHFAMYEGGHALSGSVKWLGQIGDSDDFHLFEGDTAVTEEESRGHSHM